MSLFGDLAKPEGIDAAVRMRLSSSLDHILERAHGLVVEANRVEAALYGIRTKRQTPGVYSRYYDLLFALTSGALDEANGLLEEIVECALGPEPTFAIVPYTQQQLGSDYARYPRLLFAEYSQANPMGSPTSSQSLAFTNRLEEAINIVAKVDPTMHAEIEELLVRIYLAVSNKVRSGKQFGGVTSFMAWGASFVNIDFYRTRWDAVQFLVHEITHGLLFGLSFEEPLVLNALDEVYQSPLRSDFRPMDGIFHATLVCGRLADFNRAWIESGLASAVDCASSSRTVEDNLRAFRKGIEVIRKYGKLSQHGRELVERCCAGLSAAV